MCSNCNCTFFNLAPSALVFFESVQYWGRHTSIVKTFFGYIKHSLDTLGRITILVWVAPYKLYIVSALCSVIKRFNQKEVYLNRTPALNSHVFGDEYTFVYVQVIEWARVWCGKYKSVETLSRRCISRQHEGLFDNRLILLFIRN